MLTIRRGLPQLSGTWHWPGAVGSVARTSPHYFKGSAP